MKFPRHTFRPEFVAGLALALAFAFALALGGALDAADWPQWRGPDRDGVAGGDAALRRVAPDGGLASRWTSAAIPGDRRGGFGSPVIADGAVYCYVNWLTTRPISERRLDRRVRSSFGPDPRELPEELARRVEAVRASQARRDYDGKGKDFARAWIREELDSETREAHGRVVADRLGRGADAWSLASLARLYERSDHVFTDAAAFDAWMADASLSERECRQLEDAVATDVTEAEDVVVSLDLADGAERWRTRWPSPRVNWGSSCTPCVVGDRVYAAGSGGTVYCLGAADGEERWTRKVFKGSVNGSPLPADDLILFQQRELVALDAATGEVRWRQERAAGANNSPVLWRQGGRTYAIAGGRRLTCVDLADGAVRWQLPGGKHGTPAVVGDRLVFQADKLLRAWKLDPDRPEPIAAVPCRSKGASPVIAGEVAIAVGQDRVVAVHLATGEVAWESPGQRDGYASPLLAGGMLWCNAHRGRLVVLDAADGAPRFVAEVGFLRCTSPAIAGTRLVVRTAEDLRCYDVAAPVSRSAPADGEALIRE